MDTDIPLGGYQNNNFPGDCESRLELQPADKLEMGGSVASGM